MKTRLWMSMESLHRIPLKAVTMGFVGDVGEIFQVMNDVKSGSAVHHRTPSCGTRWVSVISGASWRAPVPGSPPPLLAPRPLEATLPQAAASQDRGHGLRGSETRLCLGLCPHPSVCPCQAPAGLTSRRNPGLQLTPPMPAPQHPERRTSCYTQLCSFVIVLWGASPPQPRANSMTVVSLNEPGQGFMARKMCDHL